MTPRHSAREAFSQAAAALVAEMPPAFRDRENFAQRLTQLYGDSALEVVRSLQADDWQSYWINPLQTLPDDFARVGEPVPGLALGGEPVRQLLQSGELSRTTAAEEGAIYIQNLSSFYAVLLLDPRPGEEILDLAAAPGGKSLAIAAAMGNEGRLAAVEAVKGRFHRLKANMERCGVTCAEYYLRDGRGVGRAVGERFDRVLLDAPCSSESHMRWEQPQTWQHWSLRKVKECQRKQKGLIRSAYASLKPGGRLIYCTCSFSPEENEMVVAHLLEKSDAELEALERVYAHHHPGRVQWGKRNFPAALSGTLRVLPFEGWDGFYIASLRKPG